MIVGFASGCFDLFHVGHLSLLRRARANCDNLIVAVNSDDSVKALKGNPPIVGQWDRQRMILGCRYVDQCHIFNEPTPVGLIGVFRPSVLFRGDDGTPDEEVPGYEELGSWGGCIVKVPKLPGVSTTVIIELCGARR